MKKVGLLIPHMLHGGAERVLSEISFMLSEKYEVFLILFDGQSINYEYSGKLIDMDCKSNSSKLGKILNIYKRVRKLNNIKKELELDLVISFLRGANIVNCLSSKQGKKLISCRGYTDFIKSSRFYAKMIKRIDGIIFPSKTMTTEFIENYQPDVRKVFLLYNPIDIQKIMKLKTERGNQELINFIKTRSTICTLGSFKKDKGFWHLLKAFSLLKEKVPNAGLVFVGNRGEMEKEIKMMAKESKFEQDILFLGYQENPYKTLAKCQLFVMSSLHEGFPNALIEAMACGVPVISTDCKSGPREILHNNYNDVNMQFGVTRADYGLLVPTFNEAIDLDFGKIEDTHEILSEAMRQLLENNNLNSTYREIGYTRSIEFENSNFKKHLYKIIETI